MAGRIVFRPATVLVTVGLCCCELWFGFATCADDRAAMTGIAAIILGLGAPFSGQQMAK